MSDIAPIVDKARDLGKAIAGHPRVQSFFEAQQAINEDTETSRLINDYQKHAQHIQELASQQKPIEVDDKKKLADYEQRMAANELFKQFTRVQVDYLDLMSQVNRGMEEALAAAAEQPSEPS